MESYCIFGPNEYPEIQKFPPNFPSIDTGYTPDMFKLINYVHLCSISSTLGPTPRQSTVGNICSCRNWHK